MVEKRKRGGEWLANDYVVEQKWLASKSKEDNEATVEEMHAKSP